MIKAPTAPAKKVIPNVDKKNIVESVRPTPTVTPPPVQMEPEPGKQEKVVADAAKPTKIPTPAPAAVDVGALKGLTSYTPLAQVQTSAGKMSFSNSAPGADPNAAPGTIGPGTDPNDPWKGTGQTYGRMALFRIQQNFKPPYNLPGVQTIVQFKVLRDGTIADMNIIKGSTRADLDQAALRALKDTEKLPELYDSLTQPFIEVAVTFEFERAQ